LVTSISKAGLATILIIIVSAAAAITHWPALSAKTLSFDDSQYLTDNILVQNPGWASAKRFLTEILKPSTVEGYYQPLAMISLMFDYSLGGRKTNLMPFHRTSLILHIANTALIIVLLYLLFDQIWIAAAAGLLFGVHPMTVEPIPWVGERKTLLAAFFSLWSLIFYLLFTIYYSKTTSNQRRAAKFYIGSFVAYLLALMSKPTSTTLPVVMLLMDYWPLRRLSWRAVLEKIPFFVLGGVSAIITVISQTRAAGVTTPSQFGLERIILILCHNIIFYLYKIVWPVNLSSHYPFPKPLDLSQPMILAGVIGTFILIPLLVFSLRWTRAALTGWLIFFAAILPAMQIIGFSNVIASDKYAYLPSAGLLMVLSALLVWFCNNKFSTLCRISAAIILLLAGAESVAARRYLFYWQDSISLYEYMARLSPNSMEVQDGLGHAFQSQGRIEESLPHYYKALQASPNDADTHNRLATALQLLGRLDEAIEHYSLAIRFKPEYDRAYNNLGGAFMAQGKLDEAAKCLREALRIRPDYAQAHLNLASLLQSQGRLEEAAEHYRKILQSNPDDVSAHYHLGSVFQSQGRLDEAIEHYRRALQIKPEYEQAYNDLGGALLAQDKLDEAQKCFREAIRINAESADAYNNMGVLLTKQGKLDEAVGYYRQAIRLKPDHIKAGNNLGLALQLQGKTNEAIDSFQQALRTNPDYAEAHYNLGMLFQSQGRFDEAADHYRRILQSNPADSEAYYCLGSVFQQQDRLDEAADYFRKTLELNPENISALDNLARIYEAKGQLDKADSIRRQLKVYRKKPDDSKKPN